MGHVSSNEVAKFLWELQLPPLTKDQENNLTDDERANRESLDEHIKKLKNIALRIEHDVMVDFSSLLLWIYIKKFSLTFTLFEFVVHPAESRVLP